MFSYFCFIFFKIKHTDQVLLACQLTLRVLSSTAFTQICCLFTSEEALSLQFSGKTAKISHILLCGKAVRKSLKICDSSVDEKTVLQNTTTFQLSSPVLWYVHNHTFCVYMHPEFQDSAEKDAEIGQVSLSLRLC